MAKVTQPLSSSEARGKVSGLVYNTWRGISYVKAKATPGRQSTARRLQVRANGKACTLSWQTISDLLRAEWNDYATKHPDIHWSGNANRLSGYNWFMRCNSRLLDIGLSIITTTPARDNPWSPEALAAAGSSSTITITWTWPAPRPTSLQYLDIWITKAQSAGRKPSIEDTKHLAYVNATAHTFTTGPLAFGTYGIFLRSIDGSTGLASPWQLLTATVEPSGPGTAGPAFSTIQEDMHTRVEVWEDPEYVEISDSNNAQTDTDDAYRSDVLRTYGYGFNLPANAIINGIEIVLRNQPGDPGLVYVQLTHAGHAIGDEYSDYNENPAMAPETFGGPADLWNATLTRAIINDPTFGCQFSILSDNEMGQWWMVDSVTVKIYFHT